MQDAPDSFRLAISNLSQFPPVNVDGVEFTGLQLSQLVSMNPSLIDDELRRTPQLVAELGRAVAAAKRQHSIYEARYRAWRDSKILEVTTDPDAAGSEGLTDGEKAATKTAAEVWVRTLSEYVQWHETLAHLEEAHSAMYAAYEGAKLRRDAAYGYQRSGVDASGYATPEAAQVEAQRRYQAPGNEYEVGADPMDHSATMAAVASAQRTPLSAPSGPPGPPPPVKASGIPALPPDLPPPGPPGPPPPINR